jgi:hypothetical protein
MVKTHVVSRSRSCYGSIRSGFSKWQSEQEINGSYSVPMNNTLHTALKTLRISAASHHKQRAVGKLGQFVEKVPTIFPTGYARQGNARL